MKKSSLNLPFRRPLQNGINGFDDEFNSFQPIQIKKEKQKKQEIESSPYQLPQFGQEEQESFNEQATYHLQVSNRESLLRRLEQKHSKSPEPKIEQNLEQQQLKPKSINNDIKDPAIRNLLGEIDALMNKLGTDNQPQNSDEYMIQTGQFAVNTPRTSNIIQKNVEKQVHFDQQSNYSNVKISKSKSKKRKVSSSSSSSSSDEEKQRKSKKYKKKKQRREKSKQKQQYSDIEDGQDSYIGNKSNSKQQSYSQQRNSTINKSFTSQMIQLQPQMKQYIDFQQECQLIPPQQQEDVFCMICEEFIPIEKVNSHCQYCGDGQENKNFDQQISLDTQQFDLHKNDDAQNMLHLINEKLIKIVYNLSRKIKFYEKQQLVQLGQIIEGCTNQIILTNDQYESLSKFIADLNILLSQLKYGELNQESQAYNLTFLTQKIQLLSMRKLEIVQKIFGGMKMSYCSNLSQNKMNQFAQRSNFKQPSPKYQGHSPERSVVSHATNVSKLRLFEVQTNKNNTFQFLSNGNGVNTNRKKIFQDNNQPKLLKNELDVIRLQPQNINQKENKIVEEKPQQFQSKEGIQYGNDYVKPPISQPIILYSGSKSKKQSQLDQSISPQKLGLVNLDNLDEENKEVKNKQKKSIISQISGFISKISIIPSSSPIAVQNEQQKKKFFDLAVQKKSELDQDHPAQQILIADLYDKCCRDRVGVDKWDEWIDMMYWV